MAVSIALIIVLGLAADYLFRRFKLPGLIGMLLLGIAAGPYLLNLISPEMMKVSGDFRKIALIVILLRAGFELHKDTLHRVGIAALLMSAIPAIFEIAGIVLAGPYLLGITRLEAAILGTILGAVSPAVVVPLMINFMDRGRGAKKGIPTLLLGASSIDDVFVIVLFTVFLGMYGGGEVHLLRKLAEIPVSIILGIVVGVIPGYILYKLFNRFDFRPPKRTMIVLGVAIFLTALETAVQQWVPIAGLLGVMAIGFIILEKSEPIAHLISQKLKKLWVFAELLLFVLVGAQVNIHVAWDAGLSGILLICIGLVFRSVGTYISLIGTPYSFQEKLFCIVAYIPKATVQAAIGAIPLAAGVASGELILAIAVLSILVTAPLGAIGIMIMGERILDYGEESPYRFLKLRERMELPRVGERLRNKKSGEVWKVIEEKEEWLSRSSNSSKEADHSASDAQTKTLPPDSNIPQKYPVIHQRYWLEKSSSEPGTGKTILVNYSQDDPSSFVRRWEILYDW